MIVFASSALCSLITDKDRAIQKPCSGIQGENEADKDAGESGAGKKEEDREGPAFCSCCLGLKDQSKFRSPGKMIFGILKSKILLWHAEGGKEAEGSKGSRLSLPAHSHIES